MKLFSLSSFFLLGAFYLPPGRLRWPERPMFDDRPDQEGPSRGCRASGRKERFTNIQRPRWIKTDGTEDPLLAVATLFISLLFLPLVAIHCGCRAFSAVTSLRLTFGLPRSSSPKSQSGSPKAEAGRSFRTCLLLARCT